MGAEPYLGEVMIFAGTYAPQNYMICAGQTLSISDNCALYSILGTTYGGDGRVTFCLPDLRGKAVVGTGQARDGSTTQLGQSQPTQKVMADLSDDVKKAIESIKPGDKINMSQEAQKLALEEGELGMNFCICVQGLYPPRN